MDVLERGIKLIFISVAICIYYVSTLYISAYLLSMSEKNFFNNLVHDWNVANERLTNNIISEETKSIFNASITGNINKYVNTILNNEGYRNIYIFISTLLLLIIGIYMYIKKIEKEESINKTKTNLNVNDNLKWMNKQDIILLKQKKVISDNRGIILGQYQKTKFSKILTLPSTGKTNKNVLVVGNSGSGKSRAFVKTNIINLSKDMHSFIISDPKSEYITDTAGYLNDKGYDIKVLNLVNTKQSHRWNPLDYVDDVIDAQYVAEAIVEKIHRDSSNDIDKGIKKIEIELIKNLITYIKDKFNKNVQNLSAIYNIISTFKAEDIDELLMHESDLVGLSEYSFYLKQTYKDKEIAINDIIDKLNILDMKNVSNLLRTSEIKLEMPKVRPCAYYIILPDMHKELDLIASIFIGMLAKKIIEVHDDTKDDVIRNREVFFMLDEFTNFGYIPKFTDRMSQFRARRINCSIISNSVNKIRKVYTEEECKEIANSCDTKLFLGCNDDITADYFSGLLSNNFGKTSSGGVTMHDLINLDLDKCIATIRGQKPAILYKYDWTNLKEYKLISGGSQTGLANWIKEKAEAKLKKSSNGNEDDIPIKVYDYNDTVKQEINNILYYDDYKKNTNIKVFDVNEEEVEDNENYKNETKQKA